MKKITFIIFILLLFAGILHSQSLNWNHTGGPLGGIVGGMAMNSEGDIYAGVYPFIINYKGLYKSTDNGNSWNKIETQFEDFHVYSIYIDKEDKIWVTTEGQDKIYLSTDNGTTWQNKGNGYLTYECWAIGESKDGILFAGGEGHLYRSTDNGDNWVYNSPISPHSFATDSNNVIYLGAFSGLYKSTNNGETWIQDSFLKDIHVASVLIDKKNYIYCGTGYYGQGDGVFYSKDGGENWTRIGLVGEDVLSLAFDSQNNLYAGTLDERLYKTSNSGQTWEHYDKGIYKKEIYRLIINEEDDIFIASEGGGSGWYFYGGGGVFRSINGGEVFEQVGLPVSLVRNTVFSGDSLIIASTPSGVQKFNRKLKKWKNIGLHNVEAISITHSDYLYAATRDEGLYKSEDLGRSWELLNFTTDTLMSAFNVLAINDDTVFVSPGYQLNFRRSFDGGENWEILSITSGETSRGLSFNNNTLFVSGSNTGNFLYRSTDLGSSFDSVYYGFSTMQSNNPLISTNDYVYLTSNGGSFNGVIRSSDSGLSWEHIFTGIVTPTIYADDNGLVITSYSNIYISFNYGNNWTSLNEPIIDGNYYWITDIKNISNSKFYFGTSSMGIYKVDLITSIEDEVSKNRPANFYLSQNFPNPFNPATTIKYSVPLRNFVSIKIYNTLGEEVAKLVNEEKPPGEYEVTFNAEGLPSGVYFYRIQAGNFSETRKMILLR